LLQAARALPEWFRKAQLAGWQEQIPALKLSDIDKARWQPLLEALAGKSPN